MIEDALRHQKQSISSLINKSEEKTGEQMKELYTDMMGAISENQKNSARASAP